MTVVALACCALTISLGLWQMRRATEKETLQARLDAFAADPAVSLPPQRVSAEAYALRRVTVRGEYVPATRFCSITGSIAAASATKSSRRCVSPAVKCMCS